MSGPCRSMNVGAWVLAVWPGSPRMINVCTSGEGRCMARASFLAWQWLLRSPAATTAPASTVPSTSPVPQQVQPVPSPCSPNV